MPERLFAIRPLLRSDAVRCPRRDPEGSRAMPDRMDLSPKVNPAKRIYPLRGSDIRPHGGSSLPPNECRSLGSRQMRWLSSRYPTHTVMIAVGALRHGGVVWPREQLWPTSSEAILVA